VQLVIAFKTAELPYNLAHHTRQPDLTRTFKNHSGTSKRHTIQSKTLNLADRSITAYSESTMCAKNFIKSPRRVEYSVRYVEAEKKVFKLSSAPFQTLNYVHSTGTLGITDL